MSANISALAAQISPTCIRPSWTSLGTNGLQASISQSPVHLQTPVSTSLTRTDSDSSVFLWIRRMRQWYLEGCTGTRRRMCWKLIWPVVMDQFQPLVGACKMCIITRWVSLLRWFGIAKPWLFQAAMLNKHLLMCGGYFEGDSPHKDRSKHNQKFRMMTFGF